MGTIQDQGITLLRHLGHNLDFTICSLEREVDGIPLLFDDSYQTALFLASRYQQTCGSESSGPYELTQIFGLKLCRSSTFETNSAAGYKTENAADCRDG